MAPESDLDAAAAATVVMPELLRSLERSAGTFAGTPSFYEAIDIADVVRARRLRRIRFILVCGASVLLIVGAVVVASLPFAMQAHSARRLAETSDSAARTVGWPYPMAMEELERARAYNRRLAVKHSLWLGRGGRSVHYRDRLALPEMRYCRRFGAFRRCRLPLRDTDAHPSGLLDSGAGISAGTVLVPKSAWNRVDSAWHVRNRCSPPVPGHQHQWAGRRALASHTVVTGHRGLSNR